MVFVGDLLFDISDIRRRARGLAISVEADVRSIEDATNNAIDMMNGYLDVGQEHVDSRGKTIDNFLDEVRQAFEDLERNATQQYTQLATTINTTTDTAVINNLRNGMVEFDLVNMNNWMERLETIPPKLGCCLAVFAFGVMVEKLTRSLKATPWRSFTGGIIGGSLGGLVVFCVTEALCCAIERKMLNGYIEELTRAEQAMRGIRIASVNVADRLRFGLMLIQLRLGNVGDGRPFHFGCVPPLILCATSSNSIKASPILHAEQSGNKHTVNSPTSVLVVLNRPVLCVTLD